MKKSFLLLTATAGALTLSGCCFFMTPPPAPAVTPPVPVVAAPAPVKASVVIPAPAPAVIPAPAPAPVVVPVVVPVPPADSDKDGVSDELDKCPGTAAGVSVDAKGCPLDSDKDGIIDLNDKCPGTALGVVVDAKGCPLDSDKDGIIDLNDKCPGTALGVVVDAKGCPLDSDRDGIIDSADLCPNTKTGLAVDSKGCPPPIEENVKIAIDVLFASGKADINDDSTADIKKLGVFMETYPKTTTVIEGHTDNVGSVTLNKGLSQRRAEAVRNYLIKNYSIAADRIKAVGFGSERPIADNGTAEGRKKNRRTEAAIETIIITPQQ